MRTAHCIKHSLPWLQAQVVRIIQTQFTPCLRKLFGSQALEGRLRRNRHEYRERDGAMREMQRAGTGFCRLDCAREKEAVSEF